MKTEKLINEAGVVKAYYCGKCGKIYTTEEYADNCCICTDCKKEIDHQFSNNQCNACIEKRSWKRDQDQTDKAEELKEIPEDVECFYYDDHFSCDMHEHLDDMDEDERPEWIHPCTEKSFYMNIADIVQEHAYDEHHEDYEFVDIDELVNFFNKWCEKQPVSYEPDMKRKISSKLFINNTIGD